MAVTTTELPQWDLTPFFPSLESREFAAAHEGIGAGVARLTALYDEHDVRGGDARDVDDAAVAAFESVLAETNELHEQLRLVGAYLNGFVTTDARDDEAAALQSRLQAEVAPLRTLNTRFAAWIARLGAEKLIASSPAASDHAWPLRKAEQAAVHQMTEAEEGLAAELNLTGGSAWNRLHGDVTSRLTADVQGERLPITVVRNLAMSTDASVRKAAYEGELEAWESVSVPLAAAHERHQRRRGRPQPAARMVRLARAGVVHQRGRSRRPRRHACCGRRVVPRLPHLPARRRRVSSVIERVRPFPGGTCSRPPAIPPVRA